MLTGTVIRSLRSSPRAMEKPSSAVGAASVAGGAAGGSAGGGGAAPIAAAAANGRSNVFIEQASNRTDPKRYAGESRRSCDETPSDEGERAFPEPLRGGGVDARGRHQNAERGAGGAVEGVGLAERPGHRRARCGRDGDR